MQYPCTFSASLALSEFSPERLCPYGVRIRRERPDSAQEVNLSRADFGIDCNPLTGDGATDVAWCWDAPDFRLHRCCISPANTQTQSELGAGDYNDPCCYDAVAKTDPTNHPDLLQASDSNGAPARRFLATLAVGAHRCSPNVA
jgi:hypothetical protein